MKITKKEVPELFNNIRDFIIERSQEEYRRGSTFFVNSIVEFELEDKNFFTTLKNFDEYVGTWETNTYISGEDDTDWNEINELTKVEKQKVIVEKFEWKAC